MIRAVFIRRVASVGLSFSHLELRDFAKSLSEALGPDATRSLFSINGYRNGGTMRKEAPFPAPSLSAQMRPSVQLRLPHR